MLESAAVRAHDRPYVLANVAMSADGKIATADGAFASFASRLDRDRVDQLRAGVDAVLIGAGTLRAEDPPLQIRDPARRRARREEGRDELLSLAILSASCELPAGARVFTEPARERYLLTTEGAPRPLPPELTERATVLRHGRGRVDLRTALADLKSRGIERLLVEGGGEVNAAFLTEDLLDELYLTLCPVIIGGIAAPTPVGGEGFTRSTLRRARLESMERRGGELFLRYLFPSSP
jgi:riboflavin-specific deaminase-like protein